MQGIVEQHEGYIEIDTTIGKGSTFHVYFPVAQNEAEQSVVITKPLTQGNERVLLVDDELMITKLTKGMLDKLGYKVSDFSDCIEALTLFAERPQDFDIVLTDYGMSKMNGKQLAEKLKEIRPDIPIILFTGYGDLLAGEKLEAWGVDALLLKPFELEELSEVMSEVTSKR